jgi:hypothetical protein
LPGLLRKLIDERGQDGLQVSGCGHFKRAALLAEA